MGFYWFFILNFATVHTLLLEQQSEGITAILDLEQVHQEAEYNKKTAHPDVHGNTLLAFIESWDCNS
jgi:hypothetical protein